MPTKYPPLDISREAKRAHEFELLQIVHAFGSASLEWIFGCRPRWATDASERLIRRGLIEEVFSDDTDDEGLRLTAAGRTTLAWHRDEAA